MKSLTQIKNLNEFEIRPLVIDHDSELATIMLSYNAFISIIYFTFKVFRICTKLRD